MSSAEWHLTLEFSGQLLQLTCRLLIVIWDHMSSFFWDGEVEVSWMLASVYTKYSVLKDRIWSLLDNLNIFVNMENKNKAHLTHWNPRGSGVSLHGLKMKCKYSSKHRRMFVSTVSKTELVYWASIFQSGDPNEWYLRMLCSVLLTFSLVQYSTQVKIS